MFGINLIDFVIGVAVGAAFAPFWMMVWNWLKTTKVVAAVLDFFKGWFTPVK